MESRDRHQFTRRNVLKLGALGAAAACSGPLALSARAAAAKINKNIPIALQLYSVRKDCGKDIDATVAAVGKMGYKGVEFAGYYKYGKNAKGLRKLLDDNGLKCAGTHTRIDTLLGDNLKRTIEFHKILGNKFLIVPGMGGKYTKSAKAWSDTAKLFTEISEKLKPHGMRTGYHNHSREFKPMNGKTAWDIFFTAAGKDVVMQLDIGNCMHGGGDPAAILKKYPGRAGTVHFKEFGRNVVLGDGKVNWKEIITLCATIGGTQWYIVEQESYPKAPLACVETCLVNLKKIIADL